MINEPLEPSNRPKTSVQRAVAAVKKAKGKTIFFVIVAVIAVLMIVS